MTVIQIDLTEPSQKVQARPGDSVRLCLAETPTTGYRWERLEPLPSGLQDEGATFESGSGTIGGAGRRCFTLRCVAPLDVSLTYVLRRSWAADTTEKRATVGLVCSD